MRLIGLGVTVIDLGTATATLPVAVRAADVPAEIVELPAVCVDAAKPVPLTVTTPGVEDDQCARFVTLAVVPSGSVPVTVNCCWKPRWYWNSSGLTRITSNSRPGTRCVADGDMVSALTI